MIFIIHMKAEELASSAYDYIQMIKKVMKV